MRIWRNEHHKSGRGDFSRSLYVDDIFNQGLTEKLGDVRDRRKIRRRTYDFEDDHVRLEMKNKRGKMVSKAGVRLTGRNSPTVATSCSS